MPTSPEPQPVVLIADDSTALRFILRPDLVLLDVDMPVLDGFQVMSVPRADAAGCDVPVILLTGRVQTAELVEGLDLAPSTT